MNKAYHYYLDSIYRARKNGDRDALAFDTEEKYEFLFNLDTCLFDELWIKATTARWVKTRDTILHHPENFFTIHFNPHGAYVNLLSDLGDSINYFQHLHHNIHIMSGIGASVFSGFLHFHERLDFSNLHYRLWAAILLLSTGNAEEEVELYLYRP